MPEAYIPILRPGWNEQKVIKHFGGLSHFTDTDHDLSLRPLVEVASDDHLEQLAPFRDAGEEVYVDLPEYLTQRATGYTEPISNTLSDYGSREEFFRANCSKIDIPVVSSFAESPVEYGIHKSMQLALEETFSRLTHRLIVRIRDEGLTSNQRSTLKEVAELTRPQSDVILFDVVDVGYEEDGVLDDNLRFLTETFERHQTGVLNVFDALNGQPENITPHLAEQFGCDLFGDFAIDKRYPPKDGGPPPVVYLRHYYPNQSYVEEFDGVDYGEAARKLVSWTDYESGHCEYCRQAASAVEQDDFGNANKWKRIRMGHYIESVLQDQI